MFYIKKSDAWVYNVTLVNTVVPWQLSFIINSVRGSHSCARVYFSYKHSINTYEEIFWKRGNKTMTIKNSRSKSWYEWQLSYTKAVFSFVLKPFCGFRWYVRVWCFSCLWELVVYQRSQPSKQNLDSSDNNFGTDYTYLTELWYFF